MAMLNNQMVNHTSWTKAPSSFASSSTGAAAVLRLGAAGTMEAAMEAAMGRLEGTLGGTSPALISMTCLGFISGVCGSSWAMLDCWWFWVKILQNLFNFWAENTKRVARHKLVLQHTHPHPWASAVSWALVSSACCERRSTNLSSPEMVCCFDFNSFLRPVVFGLKGSGDGWNTNQIAAVSFASKMEGKKNLSETFRHHCLYCVF